MKKSDHKNFAVDALGVSTKIYDELNAENEGRNSAIRAARAEWERALDAGDLAEADKRGLALDAILAKR